MRKGVSKLGSPGIQGLKGVVRSRTVVQILAHRKYSSQQAYRLGIANLIRNKHVISILLPVPSARAAAVNNQNENTATVDKDWAWKPRLRTGIPVPVASIEQTVTIPDDSSLSYFANLVLLYTINSQEGVIW